MPDPGPDDELYERTMRLLYFVLIVGNLVLVYEAWKNTASGIEWRARATAQLDRLRTRAGGCAPCARRKQWLRDRAHMLFEATTIVEQAQTTQEGTE